MINKVVTIFSALLLSSCTVYQERDKCTAENSYIESNPTAMEHYLELRKTGQIKSYYVEQIPATDFIDDKYVLYKNDFDFVEKNFNDNYRNGIYTIIKTDSITNDCLERNVNELSKSNCYLITKNINNEIKSDYKYTIDNSEEKTIKISFTNLRTQEVLFTNSIKYLRRVLINKNDLVPCPIKRMNYPDYRFNPYNFYERKN